MAASDSPGVNRTGVIVVACLAAAIAIGVERYFAVNPVAPTHAPAWALIDRFEKVAFRDDVTPEDNPALFRDRLLRWEHPVRLRFVDVPQKVQDHAAAFLTELQKLIGRRVWVVPFESVTPSNVRLSVVSPTEFKAIYQEIFKKKSPKKKIEKYTCFIDFSKIYRADRPILKIYMNSFFEDVYYKSCVLEEIVQSLGLIGDTFQEFDSLFVEVRRVRLDFPLNDKILLRTLYDPRLRDGMPREQVMARVRQIIPELLAAYEAEGVEGLYQPLRDASW